MVASASYSSHRIGGTPVCSGAPTPGDTGSLSGTSASYAASYSYDAMNRLTASPLGAYTYGDSAHADAATAIGSTWSASYDEVGNLTCRAAPGSGATCAGSSPTGALLGYDNEERLYGWQNAQTNPTQSAAYLYDGAGQRVQQTVTSSGGTTTTTSYIGNQEEVTTSGSTTTTTAYYGGIAESVNGALSYLLSDGLGSVSEAVSTAGTVSATQLYGPYGSVRYQSGTLPTDKGYTGQVADAASTGLDYYGARYYDPVAGQFTSADPLGSKGLASMRGGQSAPAPSTDGGLPSASDAAAHASSTEQQESDQHAPTGGAGGAAQSGGHVTGTAGSGSSAASATRRDGLNLYLYVQGNPESHTDPTGMFTIGICVSAGGGAAVGGFVQLCFVGGVSASGTLSGALTQTAGAGGYAGIGGGIGIGFQASNAQSVSDLSGPFVYGGAGGTVGFGVDADGFVGIDRRQQPIYGGDLSFSGGGDVHIVGGASVTNVTTFDWTKSVWGYSPIHSDGGAYARQVQQWIHQQIWSLLSQMTGWPPNH